MDGGQKRRGGLGLEREVFFFSLAGERADQRLEGTCPSALGNRKSAALCVPEECPQTCSHIVKWITGQNTKT